MDQSVAAASTRRTRTRYLILLMLFAVTTLSYADRSTLSIAGTSVSRDLGLSPVAMGYIFSAFGWAYVIAQIPGGSLLDRFGSRRVYAISLLLWSAFTFLQGFVGYFPAGSAVLVLFGLRFLLGVAESPSMPANSRIVAAWFPTAERGTASATFNSAQYFALVLFSPIMGWLTHSYGWQSVFFFMGSLGFICTALWLRVIHNPRDDPRANAAELRFIELGGALVDMDGPGGAARTPFAWKNIRQLLGSRMMIGIYIGQYCITTLTYFFATWFPIYLAKERGLSILQVGFVAALPALFGFVGSILGGMLSDALFRRGHSLSLSRKLPIVAGMLLSVAMIGCNYVHAVWLVIALMAVSFFGKGVGALGWTVVSDTSPKEITGLSGSLFNLFGNTAAITTPIVIGYIVQGTGSFAWALVFVAASAIGAILSYVFVVGEIKRMTIQPSPRAAAAA